YHLHLLLSLSPPIPATFSHFFFNATPPTENYTLSLHDALPISSSTASTSATTLSEHPIAARWRSIRGNAGPRMDRQRAAIGCSRSEEHTSELQSRGHLVCRLLLEKKKQEYRARACSQRLQTRT